MIFCSKNEDGVPAWQLVLNGRKDVTRRLKPMPVGKIFAVQPGRGKKAVCQARVISCVLDEEWRNRNSILFQEDARREGFRNWIGVWTEIRRLHGCLHISSLPVLYRIEFEVVKRGHGNV